MEEVMTQEKDTIKTFKTVLLPGSKIEVVKLTLIEMGFFALQTLGDVQGKAFDMGLKRMNMKELKAFRDAYPEQPVGEHLLAIVVHENTHLWMLENHVGDGVGIMPHHAKHDSKTWRPDDIFCFKK